MILTRASMPAKVVKGALYARVPLNLRRIRSAAKQIKRKRGYNMKPVYLKRSTVAAMNQAFQKYREQLSKNAEGVLSGDEVGNIGDINSYLLMLFCRELTNYASMNGAERLLTIARLTVDFQKLDTD